MNRLLNCIAENCGEIVEADNALIRAASRRFCRDTLPLLRAALPDEAALDEVFSGVSALVADVELAAYLRGIQDFAGLLCFDGNLTRR